MKELFRRYVLHNFGLKVLSLLLATGLWMAISPENQPAEMALRVPIEFHQVPDNIAKAVHKARILAFQGCNSLLLLCR